ncbi:MAG TPA: N-acetylmuramoyl-L-alanine amidase [Gemmatimonadales bacterium]|nr:N-acetylmuramoyl-L-alanine amidase [Gemmatimonadales bacterium]
MIALLVLRLLAPVQSPRPLPGIVIIATPAGETSVPVSDQRGSPALAASLLAIPMHLSAVISGARAEVTLAGTRFVFELGAPFARAGDVLCSLVDAPYLAEDTLYLPLAWIAECVPRVLGARYSWDADAARLLDRGPPAAVTAAPPAPVATPVVVAPPAGSRPNPMTGLRLPHTVVIDPGHGGNDPGNPGKFFPGSLTEKDITLAISRLLRAELLRRGITATLTRAGDTLIALSDRGSYCHDACDLFVSVHVNSMPSGRAGERASGVETYFLSDAKTEDARRVAAMENDAIRFEASAPGNRSDLGFIIKDLQQNEYIRESARLAELVQEKVAAVHPGEDRGVQQAGFMVLTTARRPAILVETGFATNRKDAAFLASSLGQHQIAAAIADGVVAYLREFERKLAVAGPAQ